jgi:voltage-gated potassium channel Kch
MLVVQSFSGADSLVERTIFNLLLLAIVLSAIRTLSKSRKRLAIAVTLGGISYTLSWFTEYQPSTTLIATMLVGYIVVFTILVIALSEDVFRDGPVDMNRIIGASCIYFVLGLVWALVYSLLETVQPGSFRFYDALGSGGLVQDKVSEFIYFSNVTLTTLGYGDIVPISQPARMFASLEAIVGQLYVAIIIARMVGLHISQSR